MEELVQQIITFLVKRESRELVLSCQDTFDREQRGIKDYLHHKTLVIKEADVFFLEKLAKKDETDPRVAWLYQGLNYDCRLEIRLGVTDLQLIPKQLCQQCGLNLYTNRGRLVVPWCQPVITYKDVVMLPDHCILLKQRQLITMLAQEKLQEKHIDVVERR